MLLLKQNCKPSTIHLETWRQELTKDENPFVLAVDQIHALVSLEKQLATNPSSESAITALEVVLESMYMPDDVLTHGRDIFHSPVVAFAALQCRDGARGYIRFFHIPMMLAKVQYSMQLRGLLKLHAMRNKYSAVKYDE